MSKPGASGTIHPAIWLIPIAMLLLALAPWPYAYYRALRVVVFGAAAYLAYLEFLGEGRAKWWVALGLIALVFNPILPVHLTREIWSVLNIGGAMFLAGHMRVVRRRSFGGVLVSPEKSEGPRSNS